MLLGLAVFRKFMVTVAEQGVPARPAQRIRVELALRRDALRLLDVRDRLAIGGMANRRQRATLEMVERARELLGQHAVVREHAEKARDRVAVLFFEPVRDAAMLTLALRHRQQLIHRLLHQRVSEGIAGHAVGHFAGEQVAAQQAQQHLDDALALLCDRVDRAQTGFGEHPSEHAGHLQDQLFVVAKAVDTTRDHAPQRAGKRVRHAFGDVLAQVAAAADDLDVARLAQFERELLDIERVAVGAPLDQLAELVRYRREPAQVADHLGGLVLVQRPE